MLILEPRDCKPLQSNTPAISVFEYFGQAVPGIAVERFEAPVVKDEEFDACQALHARGDPAIALGTSARSSISRGSLV